MRTAMCGNRPTGKYGQVDAHGDALALMRSFAGDGADVDLKAVAGKIAPIIEGHLKMARDQEAKIDE